MISSTISTGKIMVFEGAGLPMKPAEAVIPQLLPGEILVRNKYATICGSDLHTYCGERKEALPTVLGHEIVGEIIEFGPGANKLDERGIGMELGDIVTWSIFSSNPDSYYANNGMPQKGEALFKYGHEKITDTNSFHGGFGEYCVLKTGTLILKIPAGLPLPIAATVNCAISTVAGAVRLAEELTGKTF